MTVVLDEYGLLRLGDAWISLSPTQEVIMRELIAHMDTVVPRTQLAAVAWPSGGPDRHAIDVHIHKLRSRLDGLGLVIHTVRGRGFLLERR